MTRCIQEGHLTALGQGNVVCTDVLRDAPGFTRDYVGISDEVQQRGLSVVNVTHHGDNRRAWSQIFLAVLFDVNGLLDLCTHEVGLVPKLL